MNPLSSFSFGKVIKTFIPGLILAGAPLLLFDLVYHVSRAPACPVGHTLWQCFIAGSFLRVVVRDSARVTAFGAAVLPLALMLGFFLNTALWFCVNNSCRKRADRAMDKDLLAARTSLETSALENLRSVLGGKNPGHPQVHLGDFYLPLMDLEKLTFLRESYFSWFEFQLNSAAAFLLTGAAYIVTVVWMALAWSLPISWLSTVIVPLAILVGVVVFLVIAGEKNLRRYQEAFVWFLVGTLRFHD